VTLAEALDGPGLVWSTWGDSLWTGQTAIKHDTQDAGQSGTGSESKLAATVTGPGTVTFWWKLNSPGNTAALRFTIGGTTIVTLTTTTDWESRTFTVPSGSQELKWKLSDSTTNGRGWLDQVQFTK
jgi:hypothetical protein